LVLVPWRMIWRKPPSTRAWKILTVSPPNVVVSSVRFFSGPRARSA
jgi:hypothetical protein